MALTAYIPTEITFNGEPLSETMIVTLYDLDSERPTGSITTGKPLPAGARGRLEFVGRHRKDTWRVAIPAIQVVNRSGVGCEFVVDRPIDGTAVRAECIVKYDGPEAKRQSGAEEKFAIR